jgi:hypothetical protein
MDTFTTMKTYDIGLLWYSCTLVLADFAINLQPHAPVFCIFLLYGCTTEALMYVAIIPSLHDSLGSATL